MVPDSDYSLDPADWEAFEATAQQTLHDAVAFLQTIRERPTWQPPPHEVKKRLHEAIPMYPTPLAEVCAQARRDILPYPTGNIHPRFWGWVMGTGTADGVIADLIASTMNTHMAGYDQSGSLIEEQVLRWLCQLFGYGPEALGIFVSGGTVANILGIVAGRQAKAGYDVRAEGLAGRPQMIIYGSSETHSWIYKCCELLGLGRKGYRPIPVDEEHRIQIDALAQAIDEDRAAGHLPICVNGNAGTVNTGAIDNLDQLADVCKKEDLWFHVDGALGGLAVLSDSLKPRLRGIERADSIAFDLHKWGYLQYEIGCVLMKDVHAQKAAFQTSADYLESNGRGIQPNNLEFAQLGIQLSRGFRALRAWMAFKTHGVTGISRIIDQNVRHVQYLAERIREHDHLELLAPTPLNVACFRFCPPHLDVQALNKLNREILMRIQEAGIAVPSSTLIDEQFAIRVANSNHRTKQEDMDILLDAVIGIGEEILQSDLPR